LIIEAKIISKTRIKHQNIKRLGGHFFIAGECGWFWSCRRVGRENWHDWWLGLVLMHLGGCYGVVVGWEGG